jgi:hypothetical protein
MLTYYDIVLLLAGAFVLSFLLPEPPSLWP